MITCPTCQKQQDDGGVFCDNCGTRIPRPDAVPVVFAPTPLLMAGSPLPSGPDRPAVAMSSPDGTLSCQQCGTAFLPGEAFCENCGAALNAFTSSPPSAPPMASNGIVPKAHPGAAIGGPPIQPVAAVAPPQVPPPAMLAAACLIVQESGARLALPNATEAVIGRADSASAHFPDIDLTPHNGMEGGVSRRHARMMMQNGQVTIEDLNTTNHTCVNKQRLQPARPQPLQNGDEVRFGSVITTFHTT